MAQFFFDPATTLIKLGLTADCRCVVDFGCGYGTFSIPAGNIVTGIVHALDIEPEMVSVTREGGKPSQHSRLAAGVRRGGCGLPDGSADYAMLFNILHAEESAALLNEARRVLKRGGKMAVMHWNYDPSTPRGPSMDIRLRPEARMELVAKAGIVARISWLDSTGA